MAGATHKRPRAYGYGIKNPRMSEFWHKYWAQPGIREKRRANPKKYTNGGIARGLDREYADLLENECLQRAGVWIKQMEDIGALLTDDVIVPDSDEGIAKETLRAAAAIALNPVVSKQIRIQAIKVCLDFTKVKPVSKAEVALKTPEQWLKEALEASKKPNADNPTE